MEEKSEKNRLIIGKWAFLLLVINCVRSVIWLSSQLTPFTKVSLNLSLNESKKEEMTFQIQARKKRSESILVTKIY